MSQRAHARRRSASTRSPGVGPCLVRPCPCPCIGYLGKGRKRKGARGTKTGLTKIQHVPGWGPVGRATGATHTLTTAHRCTQLRPVDRFSLDGKENGDRRVKVSAVYSTCSLEGPPRNPVCQSRGRYLSTYRLPSLVGQPQRSTLSAPPATDYLRSRCLNVVDLICRTTTYISSMSVVVPRYAMCTRPAELDP
jgi:hypothetical protein